MTIPKWVRELGTDKIRQYKRMRKRGDRSDIIRLVLTGKGRVDDLSRPMQAKRAYQDVDAWRCPGCGNCADGCDQCEFR